MTGIESIAAVMPGSGPDLQGASLENVRREFDAMILRMLLDAGAMPSTASVDGMEWSVMGGTLTQILASELAGQIDLGLGRLLLSNGQ
jgi:Rod binding domain-containing protein